ncbi:MAG: RecQ family zinc-binding domain-containing protein, partial [Ginsengibacter sp.]
DINDFTKKFKLDIFTTNNVLKILGQEALISYSEQFFSPSTVVFTTEKAELELFLKSYPEYDSVIKGLLRSYEGIFDYACAIDESYLAKFISAKREIVLLHLNQIRKIGIIDYTPKKDASQIKFLQNRVRTSDLVINEKNILKRKRAFEKRMQAILKYALEKQLCRSKTIAAYFNDYNVKRCGVCDNCLREKNITITKEEFENICSAIEITISEKPAEADQLVYHLRNFEKSKVWKILNYLQEECIVSINPEGVIHMKKA